MECKRTEHLDRLFEQLSSETIDKILESIRVAPDEKFCFLLPTPKNRQEAEAMVTFFRNLEDVGEDFGDPLTFPKLFPFL